MADFFDLADRQVLREEESSDLIAEICVPSISYTPDESDSFELNGLPSSELFVTSTPFSNSNDATLDPFVFAPPIAPPITSLDQISNDASDLRNNEDLLVNSSDFSGNNVNFEFLSNVWNRPRRIIYSDDSEIDLMRPDLPDRWTEGKIKCIKYVDDCLSLEKVLFKDAVKLQVNGETIGLARASKTESHFRTVKYNASRCGMQINEYKTKVLCTARSYKPEAYFHTTDGTRVSSSDSMKILGFTFTSEPNVREQVCIMQKKFKSRIWALRHLKKTVSNNLPLFSFTRR